MKTLVDLTSPIAGALREVVETFDAEVLSDLPFVNRLADRVRAYRGKLLRPKLLLLSAAATGGLRREHIVLGAVVEMVHMATLVHDDVLDQADVRRRNATVNRLVGNEGAVLLGDYLISHAYHLCSSLDSAWASRRIAAVTNTVCEGELMQIEHRGDFSLCEEQYHEIIRRKTAALTSVCCELGASVSGAEPAVVRHMTAYGGDLGIAFQIIDDLLDLTATISETGKTVGRDADLGKMTLPAIRFRDQSDAAARALLEAAFDQRGEGNSDRLRTLLADSDTVEYATDVARSYAESAVSHLADLPDGDAKDGLVAAAEFVIQRRQ